MRSRHHRQTLNQNPIFRGFGNTKFDDGLGWNLDLLLRLWIETRARFPLLLHQLAKTGQNEFTALFDLSGMASAKWICTGLRIRENDS